MQGTADIFFGCIFGNMEDLDDFKESIREDIRQSLEGEYRKDVIEGMIDDMSDPDDIIFHNWNKELEEQYPQVTIGYFYDSKNTHPEDAGYAIYIKSSYHTIYNCDYIQPHMKQPSDDEIMALQNVLKALKWGCYTELPGWCVGVSLDC